MSKYRELYFDDKKDWLEFKKPRISGTDSAAIMGVHSFETRMGIWRKKKGIDPPVEDNDRMEMGRMNEPWIAKYTAKLYNAEVVCDDPYFVVQHPEIDYVIGTPDLPIIMDGRKTIVEIKTTGQWEWTQSIPVYWFYQANYYAGIMGYSNILIAAFNNIRDGIVYHEYDFNEELYTEQLEAAVNFHDKYLLKNIQPPAQSGDEVQKYIDPFPGKKVYCTEKELMIAKDVVDASRARKLAKELYEDGRGKLKGFMGDAEYLLYKDPLTQETTKVATFKQENKPVNGTKKIIDGKTYVNKTTAKRRVLNVNYKNKLI